MKFRFLVLFLVSSYIYGQSSFDSLVAKISPLSYKEQISSLNNFTWKYRNIDPPQAIKAAELSMELSGVKDDKRNQTKVLGYLSVIYRDEGEYQKSLELCNRAYEIANIINDKEQVAYANNNIATIYRLMGNYPLALDYMYSALRIFEETGDKTGIAYCTYNIGIVYLKQKNYKKARDYFDQTVKTRESINDKDGTTKARGRIAEILIEQRSYSEAMSILESVRKAYLELNDRRSLIYVNMGMARIHEARNDFTGALAERIEALSIAREFKDVEGVIANSGAIGILYARMNDFGKGTSYLDSAYSISKRVKSSPLKLAALKLYSEFAAMKKDYKTSYTFLKMHDDLHDSLEERDNSMVISEEESVYMASKKEKEKELLKVELEYQKKLFTYSLIAALFFAAVVGVIILLYFSLRKANKKLGDLNAMKDKFFTIIAHDLKNPFNVLLGYSEILTDKEWELSVEEKEDYIKVIATTSKRTYNLLENLLYWARSQTNRIIISPQKINIKESLADTIELLSAQAAHKKIRFNANIQADAEAYIDPEILKLVARNLATNALKFTPKEGSVEIGSERSGDFWTISVKDTGIGINPENLKKLFSFDLIKSEEGTEGEKGTGLGLLVCYEFILKSGGRIRAESELNKGTTFYFTIPALSPADRK